MDSKIKTLVVGCGEHSQENLIPSLISIRDVEVTAICDNNNANLDNAAHWFPAATKEHKLDYSSKFLSQFDSIVVAATPQVHSSLSEKALSLGIPIFVEKPPTVDTKTLKTLADLADKKNVITCVGHNLRHSAAALEFQNSIRSTDFGRPVSMEMRYMASKPRGSRWGLKDPLWSFMLSHANHAIDLMIYHMGSIKQTVAARAWPDVDGGVAIAVQFLFHSGAIGNLLASSYAPHFTVSASVLSDRGCIANMNGLHEVKVDGLSSLEKRWNVSWAPRTLEAGYTFSGYKTELDRFFQAIINGTTENVHPSFIDEVDIYEAMDNIVKSISEGKD